MSHVPLPPLKQPFLSPSIPQSHERRMDASFTSRYAPTGASHITNTTTRLVSIDLLRGMIMMVMAWDHTKDGVANKYLKYAAYEVWSGSFATYDNNVGYFIARTISHWCAPGFFLLMGMGMLILHTSRTKKGWSSYRIIYHFLVRGIILIILGRIVTIPFWVQLISPSHYDPVNVPSWAIGTIQIFEVLTALGLTMITVGMMLPILTAFRAWALGPPIVEPLPIDDAPPQRTWRSYLPDAGQIVCMLLAISIMAASNAAIVYQQGGDPTLDMPFPRFNAVASTFWEYTLRFLLYPGAHVYGDIAYPLIPWMSLTLMGISLGWDLLTPEGRSRLASRSLIQSIIYGGIFLILRLWGGEIGNYRGRMRGDLNEDSKFISFFDVCKYPPSPSYITMTTCMNLGMLAILTAGMNYMIKKQQQSYEDIQEDKINNMEISAETRDISACWLPLRIIAAPMLVFGRVPLFYYTIHWFILGIFQIFAHIWSSGLDLYFAPIFWFALMCILYLPCRMYGRFKENTEPDSLWRLL